VQVKKIAKKLISFRFCPAFLLALKKLAKKNKVTVTKLVEDAIIKTYKLEK